MFMGERLAELRKDRCLRQGQLDEETGIARDSISAYERNRYCPGSHAEEILARYFNVSLDYFHGLTDEVIPLDNTCIIVLPVNSPPELKVAMMDYLDLLKIKYNL